MTQLSVRNVPDAIAWKLKQRAAAHGVTAQQEHLRILQEALANDETAENEFRTRRLLQILGTGELDDKADWVFDRNDPRNVGPPRVENDLPGN